MPLYLDIHRNLEGATPESIREGHIADLEAQEAHGVKYLKYWFDEKRGTVCCLVEAPNEEACHAVHRKAHGLVADEIISVEDELVAAFLGGGSFDDLGAAIGSMGEPVSAFRTLMFTDLVGSTALVQELGDHEMMELMEAHDHLLRGQIHRHHGRKVKHTGDGAIASFADATAAVACARDTQRAFAAHREAHPEHALHIRIGLSAGEPVSRGNDIFGSVVNLAARVCDEAERGEILAAGVVRELCLGKNLPFEACRTAELKGFPEPVSLYRVPWEG